MVNATMRLDQLLLARGLAESSKQAQGLIMAGKVLVNDRPVTKPATLIADQAVVRLSEPILPWVSRGGFKLAHALAVFTVPVADAVCLDVGASTGGFTDVLLHHGARRVYALDVGYGQLAWKLAQDSRVVVVDRTNIRQVGSLSVPEPVDLLTMDVSFIALSQALPPALALLRPAGWGVVLLKPQFELPRGQVTKGGVVHNPEQHQEAMAGFARVAETLALTIHGTAPSPVTGAKGNKEFLVCFQRM